MARDGETGSNGHGQGSDLHAQILELLLDKVRTDPYPSTTHLDMIEGLLRGDEGTAYAEALMAKVRDDQFPSIDHLRRLLNFA